MSNLQSFEDKLDQLANYVRGVAEYYFTGLIVHGAGGIGKSYTVTNTLDTLKVDYYLQNSRITAKGLVDLLGENKEKIIVLEDCENLMKSDAAAGVLRSALFAPKKPKDKPPYPRPITWRAHKTKISFTFLGAIIYVANRGLGDRPEFRAVANRVPMMELSVTDKEVEALMLKIARKQYEHNGEKLSSKECVAITEYIIGKINSLQTRRLDLRLQQKAYNTYLLCRKLKKDWREMVDSDIQESFIPTTTKLKREESNEQLKVIADKIKNLKIPIADKIKLWEKQTGKKKSQFYIHANR